MASLPNIHLANPLPELDDGRKPIDGSTFADHLARKPPSKTPGTDLHYRGGMPDRTPVMALAPGVVDRAEMTDRGGVVAINHGRGLKTVYRHLRNLQVAKGQAVLPAQHIGDGSFDPKDPAKTVHLHLELLMNGQRVDPSPLLRQIPVTTVGVLPRATPGKVLDAVVAETQRATRKARGASIPGWAILLVLFLMSSNR